jgi:hypothetical protein
MKNFLFAVALLSLALAVGCATGGNGETGGGPSIAVTDDNNLAVGATLSVTFTATVKNTTSTAVTWSLSGTDCTGSACGTLTPAATTPATAVYVAPAIAPSPSASVSVTATLVSDSTVAGSLVVNVIPVTVVVAPTPASPQTVTVGENLAQEFTAVAVPDAAPQTFLWSLLCTTTPCGTLAPDPNNPGAEIYTGGSSAQSVQISATWSPTGTQEMPQGVNTVKLSVAASRVTPNSTYGFQFSGYDASNLPVAVVGTVFTDKNGLIAGGVEDVLSSSGPQEWTVNSGSYTPIGGNNNLGTLTLNLSLGATNIINTYTAVLTASGNIQMIESDATGVTGSGIMQKSGNQFNGSGQTFVFGFTGVDSYSNGNRVGYVGMLPMTPNVSGTGGTIAGGMMDTNDNKATSNICGASPCSVAGTYTQDSTFSGLWHMTLTAGTATLDFDFVVGGGATQTKTGPNPLTLYAISTDPIATNPAVSGPMAYQVPTTYNNATFDGSSVSALTGASANVALINGVTDGTSGGTGGTGGFTGNFDQNNNGTVLSVSNFPSVTATSNPYTYVASSGSNGRYIFQMLGNPNATTAVAPIPFVLYASGANRGYLLDQSSAAVMTGSMIPQAVKVSTEYAASELPGTYAAAPFSNSDPSITPVVQNLLLTSPGGGVFSVAGTQNPSSQALTGSYTIFGTGTGTITLTSPPAPTAAYSVIYAIDATTVPNPVNSSFPNYVVTDFMVMGSCSPLPCSGTPSAILFAQQ